MGKDDRELEDKAGEAAWERTALMAAVSRGLHYFDAYRDKGINAEMNPYSLLLPFESPENEDYAVVGDAFYTLSKALHGDDYARSAAGQAGASGSVSRHSAWGLCARHYPIAKLHYAEDPFSPAMLQNPKYKCLTDMYCGGAARVQLEYILANQPQYLDAGAPPVVASVVLCRKLEATKMTAMGMRKLSAYAHEAGDYRVAMRSALNKKLLKDVVCVTRGPRTPAMKDWRSFNFETLLSGATTKDGNYQGLVNVSKTFKGLARGGMMNRNFLDSQGLEREDLDEMVEFMLESFPEGNAVEEEGDHEDD